VHLAYVHLAEVALKWRIFSRNRIPLCRKMRYGSRKYSCINGIVSHDAGFLPQSAGLMAAT
jgi:hypothetical protein